MGFHRNALGATNSPILIYAESFHLAPSQTFGRTVGEPWSTLVFTQEYAAGVIVCWFHPFPCSTSCPPPVLVKHLNFLLLTPIIMPLSTYWQCRGDHGKDVTNLLNPMKGQPTGLSFPS